MLFCEILVLFEMIIKEVLNDLVILKPRAAKMIRTIEKMNKILKYYRKYRNYLIFSVKPFSINQTLTTSAALRN